MQTDKKFVLSAITGKTEPIIPSIPDLPTVRNVDDPAQRLIHQTEYYWNESFQTICEALNGKPILLHCYQ